MRIVSWLIMAPITAAAVAFAISNRGTVHIDAWPLPQVFDLPVYAVVLGAAAVGFLAGGIVSWASAGPSRRKARQKTQEAATARYEASQLRERIAKLEDEAQARRIPALPKADAA